MNLEKVIFGFFILLAASLNFGFFIGDISDPSLPSVYELIATIVVSLVATVLKFGDRTQIGEPPQRSQSPSVVIKSALIRPVPPVSPRPVLLHPGQVRACDDARRVQQ